MDKQQGFNIDQEVDLLEYLRALLRYKYRIVIAATLCAICVFAITLLIEDRFTAVTLVAVNINEEPGGVSPKTYRSSDTLGLLEHDFLLDAANAHSNEIDRMMATMKSFAFSQLFIEEQNLLPYLFRENWDSENQQWKDGVSPDPRVASIRFEDIRFFNFDDETELLSIGFSTNSKKMSADLANALIPSFNNYIKKKQSTVINNRRDFLNKRLQEVDNIELHRSIFRMIETQLAAESLLHARLDYPLEVIQPALEPLFKNYPKRKQWSALTFILVVLLGIVVTIGSVVFKKIKQGLASYNIDLSEKTQKSINQLNEPSKTGINAGDEWVDNQKDL